MGPPDAGRPDQAKARLGTGPPQQGQARRGGLSTEEIWTLNASRGLPTGKTAGWETAPRIGSIVGGRLDLDERTQVLRR